MSPTTSELEAKLQQQQKDYLARLQRSGQLPTVISRAWKKAGGAEQTALRGEEANLLKKYVSAGAESREKYKDVWDPFARERLATQNTALSYAPIANIRKELAMRAEALGVATSSSQAMYGAETERAQTGLSFTQSAYERALNREREAQRQRERAEDIALSKAKVSGGGGGGGSKSTSTSASKELKSFLASIAGEYRKMSWNQMVKKSKEQGIDPVFFRDAIYRQALDAYGDTLSESAIKNLVYKQYFPDGWR